MKVLLSIKPEFAEKILLGEKKFEFRKVLPKAQGVKTIIIYATMPLGKIVGEFDIGEILSDTPQKIWRSTKEQAGITQKYFNEYFEGKEVAHAIGVKAVRRFKRPAELSKYIESGIAPQSFCYVQ